MPADLPGRPNTTRMRRIIKWALNHLPRTLPHRPAGWKVPVMGTFHRGPQGESPVRGAHYR